MPFPSLTKRNTGTSYSMDPSNLASSREHVDTDGLLRVSGSEDPDVAASTDSLNREEERHKQTWEEKEKELYFSLEEDLYALMYLCRFPSITFFITAGVFGLQAFILLLIMADLIRDAPRYPEIILFPVNVPIDVPTQVVIAQFVSLVVATLKEEDIFVSLKAMIIVGHDERVETQFPGATPLKWWISNLCRLSAGLGTVVISFFFIVGADNVLDIFSDFAAMEFISQLDNIVFKLARWGYLGKMLQRKTIKMESVRMENRREQGRCWFLLVFLFLGMTLIPLITCWSLVRQGQSTGFYLEKSLSPTLLVKFGDDQFGVPKGTQFEFEGTQRDMSSFSQSAPPTLHYAYFSASYQAQYNDKGQLVRYNGRPVYFERNAENCMDDPTCGVFYYCEGVEAWVFTIPSLGEARKELDKCDEGWLARSEKTEAWSLEAIESNDWYVWTGVLTETKVSVASDRCQDDADCSFNGVCDEEGACQCFDDWQSRKCDIPRPYCPAIAFVYYGESSRDYETIGPFRLSRNEDGSPLEVYERPVYHREYVVANTTCASKRMFDIYLYSGTRWYFTFWCEEDLQRYVTADGEFRMEENLHSYWDNLLELDVKWYSDRTSSVKGTALTMYEVRESFSTGSMGTYGVSMEAQGTFECLDAPCVEDESTCGRKGSCETYEAPDLDDPAGTTTMHQCKCRDYFGGIYCQYSPNGSYAREHFENFITNPSAATTNEYELKFWYPEWAEKNNKEDPNSVNGATEVSRPTASNASANNGSSTNTNEEGSNGAGSDVGEEKNTTRNIFNNQTEGEL